MADSIHENAQAILCDAGAGRGFGLSRRYQFDITTVIPPGWGTRVDGWGNLWVEREETADDSRHKARFRHPGTPDVHLVR